MAEVRSGAVCGRDCQIIGGTTGESLQDAFKKFKQKRMLARKQAADAKKQPRDEAFKSKLRAKFVEQAKKYLGVPYAQKYHEPGTPDYEAPLFLDCCGLVRRVMDDLQEDFGFRIGRWNQAYMLDLLPNEVALEDMKPGDLVFYTGTYYSPKAKKQKHDCVHVEIYLGNNSTIGARWKKGHVSIFPSYKFESTSYHSIQFHFRSLDTWLEGTCKSFCPEHEWKLPYLTWEPGNKSIFSDENAEECEAAEEGDDGDAEQEEAKHEDGQGDGRHEDVAESKGQENAEGDPSKQTVSSMASANDTHSSTACAAAL